MGGVGNVAFGSVCTVYERSNTPPAVTGPDSAVAGAQSATEVAPCSHCSTTAVLLAGRFSACTATVWLSIRPVWGVTDAETTGAAKEMFRSALSSEKLL